eukprot:Protomagalhaensia_wolfi_Nauph_80__5095@NODE_5426_length_391_cov_1_534091_g4476_i0_p1_GENE_NODE_5426_length_391_cov_1_534091_g4476_i0NODE_5426_length_391_cov_1_534091_g4476_i0_p1_ORF_typecomplete_len111_score10_04SDF/PF00375_18/0_034DUF2834/PF11196_8/0_046Kei1/PF08552_11/0_043DDE_Tnp_Tn3/PF01526_17/0_077YniB/PF14002_6/0_26DUF1180/PF06679_12/0_086Adeno_E3_14_5/PF04834_12/0_2Adeno_E3_14_5/PF04834_12/5e02AJAP1_PANP_C/PF15298_6/0_55DUF3112/PF11309_8/19_NODE_5426_length_391_cov_1_534091_g4476_i08340
MRHIEAHIGTFITIIAMTTTNLILTTMFALAWAAQPTLPPEAQAALNNAQKAAENARTASLKARDDMSQFVHNKMEQPVAQKYILYIIIAMIAYVLFKLFTRSSNRRRAD